jgi:hypothetical protein
MKKDIGAAIGAKRAASVQKQRRLGPDSDLHWLQRIRIGWKQDHASSKNPIIYTKYDPAKLKDRVPILPEKLGQLCCLAQTTDPDKLQTSIMRELDRE